MKTTIGTLRQHKLLTQNLKLDKISYKFKLKCRLSIKLLFYLLINLLIREVDILFNGL